MISDIKNLTIADTWEKILPEEIFVSVGCLGSDLPPLSAIEQTSLGAVNSIRMREFSAGRMHARHALEQMGIYNAVIPKNKLTGAPIWPKRVVGSITHANSINNSHVAAVVASSEKFKMLGIDAEFCDQIHPSVWSQFLSTQELRWISSVPMSDRSELACKAWTLKEAAIKAAGKGDMMTWQVFKESSSDSFEIRNTTLIDEIKLKGRVILLQKLTLAIVYCDAN